MQMNPRPPTLLAADAIKIASRGGADGSPYVAFTWGPLTGRLSADEARACALSLLLAAEATQTDQFLCQFAQQIAPGQAAALRAAVQRLRNPPNLNP